MIIHLIETWAKGWWLTMPDSSKIAVGMSVYKSDKLNFLQESVDSILSQSYKNFHFFIEVDGEVPSDIENFLLSLSTITNVSVAFNEMNLGLAQRLNIIIDKVIKLGGYSYFARMDADDISHQSRFEEQITFLEKKQCVSILGTDVVEIDEVGNPIFFKKMEHKHVNIVKNIIKKCPFNHPTVVFRMDVFIKYNLKYRSELKNTQDYYLWIDAIKKGLHLANINKPLLQFRVDKKFHSRRGVKKSINEFKSRIYAMKELRLVNFSNILHSLLLLSLRLSPSFIKSYAYKKLR